MKKKIKYSSVSTALTDPAASKITSASVCPSPARSSALWTERYASWIRRAAAAPSSSVCLSAPDLPLSHNFIQRFSSFFYGLTSLIRFGNLFSSIYPSATSNAIMITNPMANPIVPIFECSPSADSGISSSTTT